MWTLRSPLLAQALPLLTCERLLPRVDQLVHFQRALSFELLPAHLAGAGRRGVSYAATRLSSAAPLCVWLRACSLRWRRLWTTRLHRVHKYVFCCVCCLAVSPP